MGKKEKKICHRCVVLDNFLGAILLGSFQCRGVLLLLHIVGQGPAVLAAAGGRVGYMFYMFHISSLSIVLSLETAEHD